MWWFREQVGRISVAFTDASCDLRRDDLSRVAVEFGGGPLALMRQVHGADVAVASATSTPQADALVVTEPALAALVRVADCTPVVVAAPDAGLAAVVHAGREGAAAGVVPNAVAALRAHGADGHDLVAWVGPRACGRCYEVPDEMADRIAAVLPHARTVTSRGTSGLDIGAAVVAQLEAGGVEVHDLGGCTIEDERFFSHRRQGESAGRFGALVSVRGES